MPSQRQNEQLDWTTVEGAQIRLMDALDLGDPQSSKTLFAVWNFDIQLQVSVYPASQREKRIRKYSKTWKRDFYGICCWNANSEVQDLRMQAFQNYVRVYLRRDAEEAEDPSSGSDSEQDGAGHDEDDDEDEEEEEDDHHDDEPRPAPPPPPSRGRHPAASSNRTGRPSTHMRRPSTPFPTTPLSDPEGPASTDFESDADGAHTDAESDVSMPPQMSAAVASDDADDDPIGTFLTKQCMPPINPKELAALAPAFDKAGVKTMEHILGMACWQKTRLRGFLWRNGLCQSALQEQAMMFALERLR
ncbi:hypothetical protein HMN09_01273000 [Mycena chlorophos]|uniref:Uncharacterized protein n=1 Tax=Mycena chlorophos TaxID=658473 RepID=A0A8H6S111_MYCCL|nr:hypothetical protein HMN09_01273000 [Mycena chlorophos]